MHFSEPDVRQQIRVPSHLDSFQQSPGVFFHEKCEKAPGYGFLLSLFATTIVDLAGVIYAGVNIG